MVMLNMAVMQMKAPENICTLKKKQKKNNAASTCFYSNYEKKIYIIKTNIIEIILKHLSKHL